MKKLAFFALFLSYLLANIAAAQTLPKSVFDPEACGCTTLESIENIKVDVNILTKLFDLHNNTKAIEAITTLVAPAQNITVETRLKALAFLEKDDRAGWLTDFKTAAAEAKSTAANKIGEYIACQFSQKLHDYYLQNPAKSGTNAAQDFYAAQAATNTTVKTDTTKKTPPPVENPNASALAGGRPAQLATAAGDPADSTPWLWIMISGSLALFSLFLLTNRPKDQSAALAAAQQEAENAKANNQKLQQQIAQKEREWQELSSSHNALKKRVDYFEQQQKQQQQIIINNNPPQNTIQNPLQNTVSSAIRRYLYAPSMDGVFANNSIKPQPDGETFYLIDMAQENTNRAPFSLILKPEVVNRAESMAQQYLLTACEIRGAGRLPQDLSQIKMTAGELVREGQGWRVAKKIILSW